MIRGEMVEVAYLVLGDKDKFGNQEKSLTEWETVENVIAYVSTTDNAIEDGAPNLDRRQMSFLFPKTFPMHSLQGAHVRWEGKEYEVMGDPHPYPMLMCPTQWNMEVKAVLYE